MQKSGNNHITVKEAATKAMQLCSRKEYSSKEIRDKIISWGCSVNDAQLIIDNLIAQKFLDDQRYAEAYVNDKLRFNKWGRIKIAYMLKMEGINSEIIQDVVSGIDMISYEQLLEDELAKKHKTIKATNTDEITGKLYRFAVGRGFEPELVNRTIRKMKTL